MEQNSDICCPEFQPNLWDGKIHIWKDKPFLRGNVAQILHMPLNMGSVISKLWKKVMDNEANLSNEESIIMFFDPSPWKSEAYIAISKDIPGEDVVKLNGTYISKVFDGEYKDVPVFMNEMEEYLKSIRKVSKKMYVHYAYCPKCMKKYGHNYMVFFAEV